MKVAAAAGSRDNPVQSGEPVLILADLHLPPHPTDSPLTAAFARFCSGPARTARTIYILGDLFDAWLGDAASLPQYAPEIALLRGLSDRGIEVLVQHGNRDFLLGSRFARASGTRLLADEHPLRLAGEPTLLAHGDQWCLADTGYQRWRAFSRSRSVLRVAGWLPAAGLRWLARRLRTRSRRQGARAAVTADGRQRQDVTVSAVCRAARAAGVRRVIHGHTHAPAIHRHVENSFILERVVLPDWRPGRYGWLRVAGDGLHEEFLPESTTLAP